MTFCLTLRSVNVRFTLAKCIAATCDFNLTRLNGVDYSLTKMVQKTSIGRRIQRECPSFFQEMEIFCSYRRRSSLFRTHPHVDSYSAVCLVIGFD